MKVGFSRYDITPPLGSSFHASPYNKRTVEGYLTPIYVNAVAFDDGEKKAFVIAIDVLNLAQNYYDEFKAEISEATGVDKDAIFINCFVSFKGDS